MRYPILSLILLSCAAANAASLAEEISRTTANPHIKLKHTLEALGGNLLGFNGREHGGKLLFADLDGQATPLDTGNVKGFGKIADRVFIFTGVLHNDRGEGGVKELTRNTEGKLQLHLVQDLKGTPARVRQRGDLSVEFQITRINAQGESTLTCALLDSDARIKQQLCPPN